MTTEPPITARSNERRSWFAVWTWRPWVRWTICVLIAIAPLLYLLSYPLVSFFIDVGFCDRYLPEEDYPVLYKSVFVFYMPATWCSQCFKLYRDLDNKLYGMFHDWFVPMIYESDSPPADEALEEDNSKRVYGPSPIP